MPNAGTPDKPMAFSPPLQGSEAQEPNDQARSGPNAPQRRRRADNG